MKLLVTLSFILNLTLLSAQDLNDLITINGDTISCEIVSVNSSSLTYLVKTEGKTDIKMIGLDGISGYFTDGAWNYIEKAPEIASAANEPNTKETDSLNKRIQELESRVTNLEEYPKNISTEMEIRRTEEGHERIKKAGGWFLNALIFTSSAGIAVAALSEGGMSNDELNTVKAITTICSGITFMSFTIGSCNLIIAGKILSE